jgi:hypothetical protein
MTMNTKLRNTIILATALITVLSGLVGCAQTGKKPRTDRELRGMGMVIDSSLAKGAVQKEAVEAISDAGNQIFMFHVLTPTGGSESSFGGGSQMSFPRWIHVTWRNGPGLDYDFNNGRFVGGTIIGDYKIEVLSRIPDEVFRYVAAARGRVIVLRFRIKDDGVLLAWDVQETVVHPSGGRGFVFSMHGGDFPCETSPYQPQPDCTSGRLEDAPWYNPLWTRE